MKAKAIFHCFGLLAAVALGAYIAEAVVFSLMQQQHASIHRTLPLSSIPIINQIVSDIKAGKFHAPGQSKAVTPAAKQPAVSAAAKKITLLLKNGSEVEGKLISEEGDWVTINMDGGDVGFHRSEISRIDRN